jgi:type IV pilus assembly protein PilA
MGAQWRQQLASEGFMRNASRGFTFVEVMIVVAIALLASALTIPAWHGYRPRSMVNDAIHETRSQLTEDIDQFFASYGRLPNEAESARYRVAPRRLDSARSVAWHPESRLVVVTMKDRMYEGKRFAFRAEPKEGHLTWTCGTIDLEPKYLPSSCRDELFTLEPPAGPTKG